MEAVAIKNDIISDVIGRYNQGNIELPVLPDLAMKVFKICEENDFSLNELVRIIETDATITSKLLSISNSPRFRTPTETETLKQAINKIGVKTTRNLVFTISNRNVFKANHPELKDLLVRLWEHSFATGICARFVAKQVRYPAAENLFTYGLLHDIGKLLFVSILDEIVGKSTSLDLDTCIDAMNQLHTDFGAKLLDNWNFSSSFKQVALCHHDLSKAEVVSRELLIVHFSNRLVRELGYSLVQSNDVEMVDLESAKHLKLNKKIIIDIAQRVQDDVTDIKSIL